MDQRVEQEGVGESVGVRGQEVVCVGWWVVGGGGGSWGSVQGRCVRAAVKVSVRHARALT